MLSSGKGSRVYGVGFRVSRLCRSDAENSKGLGFRRVFSRVFCSAMSEGQRGVKNMRSEKRHVHKHYNKTDNHW